MTVIIIEMHDRKKIISTCVWIFLTLLAVACFVTCAFLFVLYFSTYITKIQDLSNGSGILSILGSILPSSLVALAGFCGTRLMDCIENKDKETPGEGDRDTQSTPSEGNRDTPNTSGEGDRRDTPSISGEGNRNVQSTQDESRSASSESDRDSSRSASGEGDRDASRSASGEGDRDASRSGEGDRDASRSASGEGDRDASNERTVHNEIVLVEAEVNNS